MTVYVQPMSDPSAAGAVAVGAKGEVTTQELDRQERAVARRSAETRAIVPSVEYAIDVDAGRSLARAEQLGCPPTALVVATAAACLREAPRLNGAYRDGRRELYGRVNVAVTLPAGEGTVTATVFDADRKSPGEIGSELRDKAERARRGELTSAELSGATFTVHPPADAPVTMLTPLINPPQAAALAVGALRQAVLVKDEAVVPGHVMTLTLACDHRTVQAPDAGRFLRLLKAGLEEETP